MGKKFLRTQESRARLVFYTVATIVLSLFVLTLVLAFSDGLGWMSSDYFTPGIVGIAQFIIMMIAIILVVVTVSVILALLFGEDIGLRDKFEGYDRFIRGIGKVITWPFRMIGKTFKFIGRGIGNWIDSGEPQKHNTEHEDARVGVHRG